MDGTYYEQAAVDELMADARQRADELTLDAQAEMVPLINAACDQQIANVDGYLDWYYSLGADYERLIRTFAGSVEEEMRDELARHLGEGVDDAGLTDELNHFVEQANELQSGLVQQASQYEVAGVPEWLIVSREPVDLTSLYGSSDSAPGLFSPETRAALSAGAGATAGVAAKAATKPLFKKAVGRIVRMLGTKAASTAVGAAVGSVVPGAGTATGAVVGVAVGTATDYASLKVDEILHREEYKEEIVESIEERRSDLLAMVE